MQAHPFGLARKDEKRAQGGAVNSLREGHLIAPPCTPWHLPSGKQRPIGKDILMDEKARESNLPPMGYGQDLKNPIECAPKRENTLFRIKDSVNFFLCTQAVQAHPFGLARKDEKRAQGGAVNSRREGHLIAPPCTPWHLPSGNRVPIGLRVSMDGRTKFGWVRSGVF